MLRLFRPSMLAGSVALLFSMTVLAQDSTLKVKEGDAFPEIKLPATQIKAVLPDAKDAKDLSLKSFIGKKNVVLFFYPRANTKGCTIESCGFTDIVEKFAALDTVVIGASNDKMDAQLKFTEDKALKIPLLADSEMKLIKALGVESPKGAAAQRVTFVIDKEGKIAKIYKSVTPMTHPEEVLKFVSEMKK